MKSAKTIRVLKQSYIVKPKITHKTQNEIKVIEPLKFSLNHDFGGISLKHLAVICIIIALLTGTFAVSLLYFDISSTKLLHNDYTFCKNLDTGSTCQELIDPQMSAKKPLDSSCRCRVDFALDRDYRVDRVNLYYGLKNFNQNYRFLAMSKSDYQLSGHIDVQPEKNCDPQSNFENRTVLPCGGLANVMFDDEFTLIYNQTDILELDRYNIALDNSRGYSFKNPQDLNTLSQFKKPLRWRKNINELDISNRLNNGLENGPFIVWMTLSTFQDFSKLYAVVKPKGGLLRRGKYSLGIDYKFGVYQANEGKKYVSIELVGPLGVRNRRLLISSSVLSIIYLLLSIIIIYLVWTH